MKVHSPFLMGALIFTANLGMQALSEANEQLDIYRAVAIAILAALIFYVVMPLLNSNDAMAQKRIETRNDQERSRNHNT